MEDTTTGIKQLKSEIKCAAAEGRACRQKINESSGSERNQWWEQKRSIGSDTRSLLIAYGLLRGMPYERMERSNRKPLEERVIHALCVKYGGEEWTRERVKGLLKRPDVEKEAA